MLTSSVAFAQTTQPTTSASTQPIEPDRTTPLGMCVEFDKTVADLGLDGGMTFYHCETAAQRRYARAELEFYVAVNKLVRIVKQAHGDAAGNIVRSLCGDSDDYSDMTVNEDGDAAAIQRADQQPIPLVKIDGKWRFAMPDWFEINGAEMMMSLRWTYEERADHASAIIDEINQGKLKTLEEIVTRTGGGE